MSDRKTVRMDALERAAAISREAAKPYDHVFKATTKRAGATVQTAQSGSKVNGNHGHTHKAVGRGK